MSHHRSFLCGLLVLVNGWATAQNEYSITNGSIHSCAGVLYDSGGPGGPGYVVVQPAHPLRARCLPSGPGLLNTTAPKHVLIAALGIVLLALVGFRPICPGRSARDGLGEGVLSLVFVGVYIVAIRIMHRQYADEDRTEEAQDNASQHGELRRPLPLVRAMRWWSSQQPSFCPASPKGSWRPRGSGLLRGHPVAGHQHLVAGDRRSVAALRLGAVDMAVSSLLGSNLFNIVNPRDGSDMVHHEASC
ncbi:MAG: hypothetical protein R2811_12045 [Flavobacteriales bacterium]